MKNRLPLLSLIAAFSVHVPSAVHANDDPSLIFQDHFDQYYPGDAPGMPLWTAAWYGEGIGTLQVIADTGNRFGRGTANSILEFRKDGNAGSMALQALEVFDEATASEVMTFSFDFVESGATGFGDWVSLYLYADERDTNTRAQRILIGRGNIANASYLAGSVVRADIVVNNGQDPITYRDGTQTLQPGRVDIWLDGVLASAGFQRDNNLRGPIVSFELNASTNDRIYAWFDAFEVRDEPYVREPSGSPILFHDDFVFHAENAAPGRPWTHVVDGAGRGTVRVRRDVGELFGEDISNQIIEYKGDGTVDAMALRAAEVFSPAIAPEVATFSFRLHEPDVDGHKDLLSLFLYNGTVVAGNMTHRIIFGRGAIGGYNYGYDRTMQVDIIANASSSPVTYRDGSQTVPSGTADIWIDGELVVAGLTTNNSNLGAIRSFQLQNGTANTPLVYFDNFIVRNVPYVTGEADEAEGYQAWRELHFAGELDNPEISGDFADPDGDGVVNLLEYALGRNPREASVEGLPTPSVTVAGEESFLTMTYQRNPAAIDLKFRIQVSEDLVTWNYNGDGTGETYTEVLDEDPTDDGNLSVTVRDLTPLDGEVRRFIRLDIVKTP